MIEEPSKAESDKDETIGPLLFPYMYRKITELRENNTHFVHYSTAEAAMNMIGKAEVWMRKSTCMNDFMEIDHGWGCLTAAYRSESGKRLQAMLDDAFPGIRTELEEHINGWQNQFYTDTYLTCISEHHDAEDKIGRLSMWRAYGAASGVALVLNSASFLNDTPDLSITTNPVAYRDADTFVSEFGDIVHSLEENYELFKRTKVEWLRHWLTQMFRYSILCTKHPGFLEEREWRLIYQPSYEATSFVKKSIESVRGTPQPIIKFPLKDSLDHGLVGIDIPHLVDRVIIGPTNYGLAMKEAFTDLLEAAGVVDAATRVFISDIPLRV
jgi:hypothetical protein